MRRLRECKNFGELYDLIGEVNFSNGAYALTLLLIIAPLFAGLINWNMLYSDYYHYDAYAYNYKCMTLWNMIFTLMVMWVGIYVLGRSKSEAWKFKDLMTGIAKKQRWILWWLALLVWTIIPVICSDDTYGAIWGTGQLASGYISHIYMIGVLGCVYLITDIKQKENVIWAFIGITDVLSVIMLAFEYDIPFVGSFSAAPGVSVYTNSNHFGYIITMACLAAVGMYNICLLEKNDNKRIRKVVFCIISFTIHIYAIMINDTLGCYLAIVFALLAILIIWRIRIGKLSIYNFIPVVIVILFTLLSYYGFFWTKLGSSIGQSLIVFISDLFKVSSMSQDYRRAGTDRIGLWIDTIKKIMERPIVGYGPDIIIKKNNQYILLNTPHNEYLECAYFLGIPGLILYLGGLIHLFVTKIKSLRELKLLYILSGGVIIGYMISAFFGVRKFNTVCYMFMFLGILAGREAGVTDKKKEKTYKS